MEPHALLLEPGPGRRCVHLSTRHTVVVKRVLRWIALGLVSVAGLAVAGFALLGCWYVFTRPGDPYPSFTYDRWRRVAAVMTIGLVGIPSILWFVPRPRRGVALTAIVGVVGLATAWAVQTALAPIPLNEIGYARLLPDGVNVLAQRRAVLASEGTLEFNNDVEVLELLVRVRGNDGEPIERLVRELRSRGWEPGESAAMPSGTTSVGDTVLMLSPSDRLSGFASSSLDRAEDASRWRETVRNAASTDVVIVFSPPTA